MTDGDTDTSTDTDTDTDTDMEADTDGDGVDREYWRNVLLAGGVTGIPRWSDQLGAGVAQLETALDDALVGEVHRLADAAGVGVGVVLLAAHAKVLAALSGERDVVTGYVSDRSDQPLPCRMSTDPETWRRLLLEASRAEAELVEHGDYPVADLARSLGLGQPPFETVLDPRADHPPAPDDDLEDVDLRVGFRVDGASPAQLRLTYRTEVIDEVYARRIAGYHLTALTKLLADPDGEHRRQSLVSAGELHHQRTALVGPRKELPDSRFHELFEQRVAAHPDAIAGELGDRRFTYRELNSRANQLARALLARGVTAERVVAVVTERNLDWLACVLAVFKAGAVYLPIEPHFPAGRIATTLARADCELVMTEPASTESLTGALDALDGVDHVFVADALAEGHADTDLQIEIGPDRLAYIYFTSGSTGEPKGAMCEHGGMLNHLYAKIDDFGIGEGQVVAQIAPQCFDISLWQLVSALLVGGTTVIVDQETLLDPQRFVDLLVSRRVNVMQVVPSYLEVLLTYLAQQPRELPDLHCVSVTGEAITLELAQRWFAHQPGIKLANAYGLTETSDDTNHEVMDRAPTGVSVPLGRAVNNVEVRVVDEHLAPVPLGAPGEIVFSGICVGRGYINDPERTRLAFMDDPLEPGARLYRSGDYGRWRPDGKLEFRGRRDAQVKIRGFRIEIGEIENAMLGVDGIRESAVVVTERGGDSKQLVGFYSGDQLAAEAIRQAIGGSLPEYMVPPTIHWLERLPLTDNGKVDKKALQARAVELETTERSGEGSKTATEERIAAIWATTLGLDEDQIGRFDDFFDRGGTSLLAVKVAIALDRVVTLKDVTNNPVLADLAALIDGGADQQSGLLQPLAEPADPVAALICFPHAGGNAVSYQPMARALDGTRVAVYAVELPGHDLAADREPFAPIDDVVDEVVAEIATRRLASVMLWGHSSGTPLAVETARALEAAGVSVSRVFLGAQLPGSIAERRAALDDLATRSDAEIAARLLAESGYGELDAEQAERTGAAYRHDYGSAIRWFIELLGNPPARKLRAAVSVVVAVDDPATADHPAGHRAWELVADRVELRPLVDGDHYFLRTNPAGAADVVRQSAEILGGSSSG